MYTRNCPTCGEEMSYKGKSGLNRANKNNSVCKPCAKKGKNNPLYGKTPSEDTRRKMSISSGGNGELNQKRYGMKTWAKKVKEKDNRRCVYCGSNKKLHAHHILSKTKHPEWALFVNNGITLCHECHIEEHKINGCL